MVWRRDNDNNFSGLGSHGNGRAASALARFASKSLIEVMM